MQQRRVIIPCTKHPICRVFCPIFNVPSKTSTQTLLLFKSTCSQLFLLIQMSWLSFQFCFVPLSKCPESLRTSLHQRTLQFCTLRLHFVMPFVFCLCCPEDWELNGKPRYAATYYQCTWVSGTLYACAKKAPSKKALVRLIKRFPNYHRWVEYC